MSAIALLTDFGSSDWFVGSMKGVILDINPEATIVDISHHIPPGDIHAAAFSLLACYKSFPKGTIFIVVVDPTVGSSRKAIVAETENYLFVGPDNGVFSFVLKENERNMVFKIEKNSYFKKPVSKTFHGRDIFAPVGAFLSKGVIPSEIGRQKKRWVSIDWPGVEVTEGNIKGAVIYIDHFGNAFTNITEESLKIINRKEFFVTIKGKKSIPVCQYYNEAGKGKVCALINSAGYLEIAVNGGSAARRYNLAIGTTISVTSSDKI